MSGINLSKFVLKRWDRRSAPIPGFDFNRPLVLFQSDDWGRVGVRDTEGFAQLRSAGVMLGEKPYDFYSLETAEDVWALSELLKRHRDAMGRPACLEMNFVLANVDFEKSAATDFRNLEMRPLSQGLPDGWKRPNLFEAYAQGIADRVFYPALHGFTHFCRQAAESSLAQHNERSTLLRSLWKAGTPYIHWRMPWVGYEYWNPEKKRDEKFLPAKAQEDLIRQTSNAFHTFFSMHPISACAPGYRANADTHEAWSKSGIRVAQNGTTAPSPPYVDDYGLVNVSRVINFEPATDHSFSVEKCLRVADECFIRGIPAIISIHSINFHSSLNDFRSRTLRHLDDFLSVLRKKHPKLLYINDADLCEIINTGKYECEQGSTSVLVTKEISRADSFRARSGA
jgi:hypothetical protein